MAKAGAKFAPSFFSLASGEKHVRTASSASTNPLNFSNTLSRNLSIASTFALANILDRPKIADTDVGLRCSQSFRASLGSWRPHVLRNGINSRLLRLHRQRQSAPRACDPRSFGSHRLQSDG